jgi:hypothetical protein
VPASLCLDVRENVEKGKWDLRIPSNAYQMESLQEFSEFLFQGSPVNLNSIHSIDS